jgi:hypothetical protein
MFKVKISSAGTRSASTNLYRNAVPLRSASTTPLMWTSVFLQVNNRQLYCRLYTRYFTIFLNSVSFEKHKNGIARLISPFIYCFVSFLKLAKHCGTRL